MSGLTGEQHQEDFIQVGTVKFPLPIAPLGQEGDWGVLHLAPLEPFSAATVAGDDTLVSDDRIPQQVWGDLRAGMGLDKYVESESLSGYQDGDLDTTQGVTVLPPHRVRVPDLEQNPGNTKLSYTTSPPVFGVLANGSSDFYPWLLWSPNSTWVSCYKPSTDAMVGISNTDPVADAIALPAGYLVSLANSAGRKMIAASDGAVTTSSAPDSVAFCEHDGKVYSLGVDGKMRWATPAEAGSGAAWPTGNVSTSVFPALHADEQATHMLEWRAADDSRAIVIVTNYRLVFYADDDYYRPFKKLEKRLGYPRACVWDRDDNLYVTNWPWSESVLVFDHQTIDEVGPNRLGGVQANQRFAVASLGGHWRNMFAICTDQYTDATAATGKGFPGRILKATDAFGWCGINRGTLADPLDWDSAVTNKIVGGFYADSRVYTVHEGGEVYVQEVPDEPALPYFLAARDFDEGPFRLVSGETDCNLEQIRKLAEWFRVAPILPEGGFGIPPGCGMRLSYQIDGGAWTTLPINFPTGSTQVGLFLIRTLENDPNVWPIILPVPSREDQSGRPFWRLRWALDLYGANGDSPIIRTIALHYVRIPIIYDGVQVAIDLSESRFNEEIDSRFYNRDREDLRWELELIKTNSGDRWQWPVTIGVGGTERTYMAMDVRVSGDEDPSTAIGIYTLTLRDLTAPVSGR